ncbi:hypothetical protein P0W64_17545 [Tsukamurella sp. 8F]|uniref:hypothetical protein n=1 Tax=unclassified Tsukamurella TaxID=2633480 RepID=UPI0023B8FCE0|nr:MULTISPECIES: hypothetical protein [unclassified Tsukamurella]MDF0530272.1 hypothetical protein [Tsukamurella sp. 8J]MDF0588590.1 hypothetical protein [Tsukamurella sp. 8F]
MTATEPTIPVTPTPLRRTPAVRALCAALAAAFAVGVAMGGWIYSQRDPVVAGYVPWTSAWTQHFIVALVGAALALAILRLRDPRPRLVRLSPLRLAAAAPLLLVLAFAAFRAGVQVLAGLDPNFTVNAWGGPTYIGAMACHYLDLAVGATVVVMLLRWLLTQRAPSAA